MLSTENAGSGCSFPGRLQANLATAFHGNAPGQCALDLAATPAGIRVEPATVAACDAYCGSNGSYQGDYLRLAPACTPDAIAKARERFKALYDDQAYAEADQALAPVYRQCEERADARALG